MPFSNANEREKLISPLPIALFVVAIAAILFLVFPWKGAIARIQATGGQDRVALEYLKLWIKAHPGEHELRMTLVGHMLALNNRDEALRILEPLIETRNEYTFAAALLSSRLLAELYEEKANDAATRGGIMKKMKKMVRIIPPGRLEPENLLLMGKYAARIKEGRRARNYMLRLADAVDESPFARKSVLEGAFELVQNGLHIEAYQVLAKSVEKGMYDRDTVTLAMESAGMARDAGEAHALRSEIIRLIPYSSGAAKVKLDIALSYGYMDEAYLSAKTLYENHPGDEDARMAMARTARWTGRPEEALEHFAWLAIYNGDEDALAEALSIGKWLHSWDILIETVEAFSARRPLAKGELLILAKAYENTGDARGAAHALESYVRKSPEDKWAWESLANLYEQHNNLGKSLEAWTHYGKLFGHNGDSITRTTKILVRMGRPYEAFSLIDGFDGAAGAGERFWAVYAELAWLIEKDGEALIAYENLVKFRPGDGEPWRRLVYLKAAGGDFWGAIASARNAWKRIGKPEFLLEAMRVARDIGAMEDLSEMVSEAEADDDTFNNKEKYWYYKALVRHRQSRFQEAFAAYKKALSLNPYSHETRLAMLSFLVGQRNTIVLRRYLRQWRPEASADAEYWRVYADAYTLLGESGEALRWRRLYANRNFDDYFWLLSLADDIGKAGNVEEAWRIYMLVESRMRGKIPLALKDLSKREYREIAKAYSHLVEKLKGRETGARIATYVIGKAEKDPGLDNYAMTWFIGHERTDAARYWMKDRKLPTENIPDWQRFALALDENDAAAIADSIENGRDLSVFDRVEGHKRLGNDDLAVASALESFQNAPLSWKNRPLLHQSAQQMARLSTKMAISATSATLGSLGVGAVKPSLRFSRGGAYYSINASKSFLSTTSPGMSLDDGDEENDLSLSASWRGKRSGYGFELGVNTRGSGELVRAVVHNEFSMRERLRTEFKLSLNEISSESAPLRLAGAKDSASVYIFNDLTRWDYALARLEFHGYHDRRGANLGQGYSAEIGAGTRIFRENPELTVRLHGFASQNRLADRLPSYAASRLQDDFTIQGIIPEEQYSLGLGALLKNGRLGDVNAANRQLSYSLDIYGGVTWPDNLKYFNVSGSLGLMILGPDKLCLSAGWANNINRVVDEPYHFLTLSYVYRFGD